MSGLVLRDDTGGLSTLTLNRPDKLNALSLELFEELDGHLASLEASEVIQAVVIRGAGKCFSAGHDLGGIAEGETHAKPNFQAHVVERLASLPRRQRSVLVLRYYERLADAEIAEVLGCSAVTVRGYASRALATLRLGEAAQRDLATTAVSTTAANLRELR